MDYRVLASSTDEGSFLITNETNLQQSLETIRQTHPGDRFELMEDKAASSLLETIGEDELVNAFVSAVGFYLHDV